MPSTPQSNEPLRSRKSTEDAEPVSTTKLERREDGDERVVVEGHKPGAPLTNPEDDSSTQLAAEDTDAGHEVTQKVAAERSEKVALIDNKSPAAAYATKDNIVHPGPLGQALHDEAVAQASLGDKAEVDVDPELVRDQALAEDKTAAEVIEEARENVELPEDPAPVTALTR